MKKIIFISVLALLAISCHKEPYPQDSDNEYLVYTAPAKGVDFTQFTTFDIPDSLLIIGQGEKPVYSQSDNALALIQAYRTNMEKMGFIYTPSNPDADLGVQLTYMINTERYVQYYGDPYWWLDYPGIGLLATGVTGMDIIILTVLLIHSRQMPWSLTLWT